MMATDVGLFGRLTAFLANFYIKPDEDEPAEQDGQTAYMEELSIQMRELKNLMLDQEKYNSELKNKLEGLEMLLEKEDR